LFLAPGAFNKKKENAPMRKRIRKPWDFIAYVPSQIEEGDNYAPQLVGLPFNILFGGIRNDVQTGQRLLVGVCYWPASETFHENGDRKEMCYFTKPRNKYFVRVIFEKNTGRWQTEKFKGKKLVQSAFGSTFNGAMLHTTMRAPEPDEHYAPPEKTVSAT
jgi:hypothetical protein